MNIHCSMCGVFCGRIESLHDVEFVCPGCVYLTAFVRYLFDAKYQHVEYYNDTKIAGGWDKMIERQYKDTEERVEVLKEIWSNGDADERA